MKHFVADFFHKLLLVFAIFAIVIGSALSLAKALLPWLPKHRQLIETIVSSTLQQQVSIQHIGIGWTRMEPFLQLLDVTIRGDSPTKAPLLTLPEVDVQFDLLRSVWHKQLRFSRIIFKNAQLKLYQDDQGQWHLAGSEGLNDFTDASTAASHSFIAWLLSVHRLQLENFTLHVQAQAWPSFSAKQLSIDCLNTNHAHRLFGQTLLAGPSQVPLQLSLNLQGSAQDFPKLDSRLYIAVGEVNPSLWLSSKQWHNWHWQQGYVKGEAWLDWQQDHWQQGQFRIEGRQWQVSQSNTAQPWDVKSQHIALSGLWQPQASQVWQWRLNAQQGQIDFGRLFRTPLPFTAIQVEANWQAQSRLLSAPKVVIQTPDADVAAALTWQWPEHGSDLIDLRAGATLHDLNHTSTYLPTAIMAPALVHWLDTSIKGGRDGTAQMVLRGPLEHFPFADHSGLMDIRGQLHGLSLNYWPGWPDITDLDIDCQFTHKGMRLSSHHGNQLGLPVQTINAVLPHYHEPAVLHIAATTAGDLAHGIDVIRQSPLNPPLAALASSDTQGPFGLQLQLDIPLSGPDPIGWDGNIDLHGVKLAWSDYPLQLDALQGKVHFDTDSVDSQNLKGQLWGSPVALQVHKDDTDPRLHISGRGALQVQQLPSAWRFSFWQGQAPYRVQLALGHLNDGQGGEFWLDSSLKDLAIHLPLGINKAAADQAPLQAHGVLNEQGQLHSANIDWQLNAEMLSATYQSKANRQLWQIRTPKVSGSVQLPGQAGQPWNIAIQRLLWPTGPTSTDTDALSIDPSTLPAMNIRVDQARFGQMTDLSGQMQVRPLSTGAALTGLKLQTPLYQITASGQWLKDRTSLNGELNTSQLPQLLQSLDLPVFILAEKSRLKFNLNWPGAPWQVKLKQLSGQVSTLLSQGSLPDVGNDNSATLGFGKVLNLLSVNSLPQHLSLNFNDIWAKGFSFNTLEGRFHLAHNQVTVPKLSLSSGIADIQSHGCIDLMQQNYQLVLEVKPHLTSSLPILATIAAGPIIGAASFVANTLISPSVNDITGSTYLLTGPWANPVHRRFDSHQQASAALHC